MPKVLYYRPASYDRMKRFSKANSCWFTKPVCAEYDPNDCCSCRGCYERSCDDLLLIDTQRCSEMSEEYMNIAREGSW